MHTELNKKMWKAFKNALIWLVILATTALVVIYEFEVDRKKTAELVNDDNYCTIIELDDADNWLQYNKETKRVSIAYVKYSRDGITKYERIELPYTFNETTQDLEYSNIENMEE